jgi:signal recognition particle subunit SRP54
MQERLSEGRITLLDVIDQVKSMNSLGGLDKIKSMIPGFGKAKIPENLLENQQAKIAKWEHIIKSMTKEEINTPEIFEKQTSRISRVAKGAGVANSEVRALLKQYKLIADMIKTGSSMNLEEGALDQKQMQKLMKKMGKRKLRI